MSYEVLARKWRPQTFDEVMGQDHITRTLKAAVQTGRISHAYLLSGPRGCGKTSTARILAKVINCTDLKDGNPCNACDSCLGVMKGNNLDMMEIDGASNTGVNEVRDLQEAIGYSPSQFQNKVYIIDEVHMLSNHAFNALLKTLEEPPKHVYFIFATTAPHKIPDTIKSRCQRHAFKRLEIGEITEQLEKICEAEKVKHESEALRLLARKAEGSMRDAESLLDQVITASSGDVKTESVRAILGLLDQEMVGGFLRTIAAGDATEVLRHLDEAVNEGVDLEELLNALIEGFRDLMVLAAPGDLSNLIFRSKDELATLREILPSYELGDLVTIVERLVNVAPRLKMASDPRILLESALVDLSLLDKQTDIREVIEALGGSGSATGERQGTLRPERRTPPGAGRKASAGTAPAPTGAAPDPAASASVSDEDDVFPDPAPRHEAPRAVARRSEIEAHAAEHDPRASDDAKSAGSAAHGKDVNLSGLSYDEQRKLWDGFVHYVRQKKVALGVCLITGNLKSLDEKAVMLRFGKGFKFQQDQVDNAGNKTFLKTMLKKYFGRELELVCFSEGDEASAEQEKRKVTNVEPRVSAPQQEMEKQPLFKKIIEEFDGEIVRYNRP